MDVHRLICKNVHVFFVPLDLPQDIAKMAALMKDIKCPICGCGSEDININAKVYKVKIR